MPDMELSNGHPGITSVFSLPTLKLLLIKEKLEITVDSSLCLDIPSQFLGIESVTQLADLVNETHLWIAKIGSCCFEVSVTINGDPIQEKGLLEQFSQQIMQCKLWNRLCLRLEHDCHALTQVPGVMYFSIHHPDLASALLPPTSTATSRFRAALISINIVEARKAPSVRAPSKKRKITTQRKNWVPLPVIRGEAVDSDLEFEDRLAVERFMSSLNFRSQGSEDQPITKASTEYIRPKAEVLTELFNASLLEAMFELLLLGPRKNYKGIRVSEGPSVNCLTTIAPGVFHVPYLESLSDRSEYLKVISSSLSRMRNAESPVLRQKVKELNEENTQGQNSTEESNCIVQTIENRIWDVLVSHSEIPPLKGRATKVRQATALAKPKDAVIYGDVDSLHIQEPYENINGHFKRGQYALSSEMLNIDASSIPPHSVFFTPRYGSITSNQDVITEHPALHLVSDEDRMQLPSMIFDKCLAERQLPTSHVGMGKSSSGSPFRINPGFVNITESRAQNHDGNADSSATYDPELFSIV